MTWRRQRNKRPRSPSPSIHTRVIPIASGSLTFDAPFDGAIQRVSVDSRRTFTESVTVLPPSPLKRLRINQASQAAPHTRPIIDIHLDAYNMGTGDDNWTEDAEEPPVGLAAIVPQVLRPAVCHYNPFLPSWLMSFVGFGRYGTGCSTIATTTSEYYFGDMAGVTSWTFAVFAGEETRPIVSHRRNPFHTIELWNGAYFETCSLKSIGLRVQMGHPPSQDCDRPIPARNDFLVLHYNGIKDIAVDYCGCRRTSDPYYAQLLRAGLYPSTTDTPRTCATLECLELYHTLTLHGKITGWDFYRLLETQTNAIGIKPPDRYQVFLRMACQYRHLLSLKRGGRGYDARGVLGTTPGELAVLCPACPRPGVNLPDDWQNAPPAQAGLYVFFLAMDACFRLKRRAISNEIRDPALSNGWAYMVEWEPYKDYLLKVGDQKEISTCTGLAALDYANSKFSRGYSATGVGMGVCARHEFVQPNGVGDLQAGERYGNMDYIFGSILRHLHPLLRKLISYDIACQWWKNLYDRLRKLPTMLRLLLVLEVFMKLFVFVVPKLHILGHTTACQLLYSLNYTLGGGQTDREGIERPWSMIGGIAASTRVSGPGARSDLLDDHWSFWNWSKLLGLPTLLRKRLDTALHEQAIQQKAFEEFSLDQAERVPSWKAMVHEFEADGTKPNPYEGKVEGLTEAQVREKLEAEEETQTSSGRRLRIHEITPVNFVTDLLEVENVRVAGLAELKKAKSTTMKINLRSLRRGLNKRIAKVRQLQSTYMPASLLQLKDIEASEDTLLEDIPLLPPSALTRQQRENGGCLDGLVEIEKDMREAQCRAALVGLRNQLLVKYRLLLYKTHHSQNQTMNTRSRSLVARNENKVLFYSKKYQAAWLALVLIAEGIEGNVGWKRLLKEDIRCLEDSEELVKKQMKAKKAEVRRARDERELRAAGITPLNIHRVQEGEGDTNDTDNEDISAISAPSKRHSKSKKMPAPKGTAIQSGESRRVVSWIWTTAGMTGSDAELYESSGPRRTLEVRRWNEEVTLLNEEWRRLPESFAHEERIWAERAQKVPVGALPTADAEGMIAYAAKHTVMYRSLALRAETTRTEAKLKKGARRARVPDALHNAWMGIAAEAGDTRVAETMEVDIDGAIERDEEDAEHGNISDEELLLTGEIDDW
ncbi:CxC2 domain-containing protein [Mycena indigotica]|uniref:CxC2 domain-containing protein n=1 Tax=Mycena indigotica TaxID=2126181 RepID=A0A8H6SAH9_9AGAR|nr:CxC2 domain-containing protein [Mycena indigotica]KAF7295136.1 CxC2 domain-containing protein [Mycena indigotica]